MCAAINRAAPGPVRLVLVTGHAFGIRAFEGIFASSAFLDGNVTVSLLIGLDDSRAAATVGYRRSAAWPRNRECRISAPPTGG